MKKELIDTGLDKSVVAKIKIELSIRLCDIDNIIVSAVEGGSTYWMVVDNTRSEWLDKPKDMPASEWMVQLILEGKQVYIEVLEDDPGIPNGVYTLTLSKLKRGIKLNYLRRPWDNNLDNMDATTADCIIQYAIFGDVIYG